MKLISFGRKIENLALAVEFAKIGSEFKTFSEKVLVGDEIVFVCNSRMWGVATVSSQVISEPNQIWRDKRYPYRAGISSIKVFSNPISFVSCGIDQILRDSLGKHWAYKVIFTPGLLPFEVDKRLQSLVNSVDCLSPSEFQSFFTHHFEEYTSTKLKKLALKQGKN